MTTAGFCLTGLFHSELLQVSSISQSKLGNYWSRTLSMPDPLLVTESTSSKQCQTLLTVVSKIQSADRKLKKAGHWMHTKGRVCDRACPSHVMGLWRCRPRKFLKIQVQICEIWCIFGDQCNRKCTTQVFNLDFGRPI